MFRRQARNSEPARTSARALLDGPASASWAPGARQISGSDDSSGSEGEVEREMMLPLAEGGSCARPLENIAAAQDTAGVLPSPASASAAIPVAVVGNSAPRLEALDAPRWIASFMIVCEHFFESASKEVPIWGTFCAWGGTWTQFFFVLSGFVLAYVEMARPTKKAVKISQLQYLRRRLVTIYPTYMFALVLCIFQWRHSKNAWATLPLNMLLMQGWIPLVWTGQTCNKCNCWGDWSDLVMVINQWVGVSWFLSALVIYWLVLRPITSWVRHLSLCASVGLVVFCWLCSLLVALPTFAKGSHPHRDLVLDQIVQFGPLGYLHVFVAGIGAARVFVLTSTCDASTREPPTSATDRLALDKKRAPFVFRYGCCIGYLVYFVLAFTWSAATDDKSAYTYWALHNGGMLPVMLLILIGGAIGADPLARFLFQTQFFQTLGRLSYAQYLLQFNVQHLLSDEIGEGLERWQVYALQPIALIFFAFMVERFYTRINTEWQRTRTEKGQLGFDERVLKHLDKLIDECWQCRCCRRRVAQEETLDITHE